MVQKLGRNRVAFVSELFANVTWVDFCMIFTWIGLNCCFFNVMTKKLLTLLSRTESIWHLVEPKKKPVNFELFGISVLCLLDFKFVVFQLNHPVVDIANFRDCLRYFLVLYIVSHWLIVYFPNPKATKKLSHSTLLFGPFYIASGHCFEWLYYQIRQLCVPGVIFLIKMFFFFIVFYGCTFVFNSFFSGPAYVSGIPLHRFEC